MKKKPEVESYVCVLGQSFPRSEVIKLGLVGLFLLLMSVTAGTLVYLDWREGQVKRAAKIEAIQQLEDEATLRKSQIDPLKQFFESYLRLTRFNEVESIRAVGIYAVNSIEMQLTLLAKRPRLYRQTLTRGEHRIEFGFDGTDVWFDQSHGVVDSSDPDLMALNRALAILEITLPGLAWDYDPNGSLGTVERMPDVDWEGCRCYVVKNLSLLDGIPVYHYIDQATGFELYRSASIQIAPRRFKDVELFYKRPLESAAYPFPSGIELLLDGRLYYKIAFESVEANKGIPAFLFSPARAIHAIKTEELPPEEL